LSLDASYGSAASSLDKLLASGGRFWSVGPSLTAPLFHGGALRAQKQAAVDAFDVQQASYRETVLTAFGQVADALQALEHDAQGLQAQADAQDAAAQALALQQAGNRAGMVAYIDVLSADVLYHQAIIGYLQAVAQRHQDTVALFVALGGGWWNAQDEGREGTPGARTGAHEGARR
jgi:outer membrane protein TolC